MINKKLFVASYLATAAWVTCDSNENQTFKKSAEADALNECEKFIAAVLAHFGEARGEELLNIQGNDLTHLAPHDLFLTRNGHGVGFWDKESIYGVEAAKELTRIAKDMGPHECAHDHGPASKLIFI